MPMADDLATARKVVADLEALLPFAPLFVESLLLQVLCFVRLGAVRPIWSDLRSLRHTSALGALLIAIQLAWAEMAVALSTQEGGAGDFQGLGVSERGAQAAAAVSSGAAARSKWPSWQRHVWPPRAHQTAAEGLRLLYGLGRRGPAPQTPQMVCGHGARPRPS